MSLHSGCSREFEAQLRRWRLGHSAEHTCWKGRVCEQGLDYGVAVISVRTKDHGVAESIELIDRYKSNVSVGDIKGMVELTSRICLEAQ